MQCHLCGRWLHKVGGSHLRRKHGWSTEQYRRVFEIPKRVATWGRGVSAAQSKRALRQVAPGGDMAAMAGRFARDRAAASAGARRAGSGRRAPRVTKPFLTQHPGLAEDWHQALNRGVSPDRLGVSSPRSVWWRCSSCGHEWQASVASRTRGSRCPRCVSEKASREARELNQSRVRERAAERSIIRTNPDLAAQLHPTLNPGVDLGLVLVGSARKLWWLCPACGHQWQAQVNNRAVGGGCPVCAGRYTPRDRSLAVLHPDLFAEWHPARNGALDPFSLAPGSGRTVWWLCVSCGYEWRTRVEHRAKRGAGCPECRKARSLLATSHPDLVSQLHPTLNPRVDARTLRASSEEQVWWLCPNGHEWQASPRNRIRRACHCPICARHQPDRPAGPMHQ